MPGGIPNSINACNQFFSHLVGVGTHEFESNAHGAIAPLAVNFGAAGTATLHGNGYVEQGTPGQTNGFGRYPVSGSKFWEADNNFSITFSQPIAAFGFFAVDIGDFSGQVTLALDSGGIEVINVPTPANAPGGSVAYVGLIRFTGPLMTGISFGNTAAGTDFFAFDDFSIGAPGQVIPLPPAAWTGLATLAALGGLRQIRRRAR